MWLILCTKSTERENRAAVRIGVELYLGEYEPPDRRFIVIANALQLKAGYFCAGDVVAETMLGGQSEWLLIAGAIQEDDYRLESLFDDIQGSPLD